MMNGITQGGPPRKRETIVLKQWPVLLGCLLLVLGVVPASGTSNYVVIITVDGLRSSIFSELQPAQLPNFSRLRNEGAYTLNARTDHDWTFTNPNHVSILTARRVETAQGHKYTFTTTPPAGQTLHTVAQFYLTSIWDIAHDRGLRTGVYVGKPSQFSIIDLSYNGTNGATDITGDDNGRDKIDAYVANATTSVLVTGFRTAMAIEPFHLSWLHLTDPDTVGHTSGWASANYRNAVVAVDGYLGSILDLIAASDQLRGRTTIILTADHGGILSSHTDEAVAANYTIPFLVWGAGVDRPGDLYFLNRPFRRDPGNSRVVYTTVPSSQPIRNIDAGNLALQLLGLPAIPDAGAFVNQSQDLRVSLPAFAVSSIEREAGGTRLNWTSLGEGYRYTVQTRSSLTDGSWIDAPGSWPIDLTTWLDTAAGTDRFYRILAVALPPGAPVMQTTLPLSTAEPKLLNRRKATRRYSGVLRDDGMTGRPLPIPARQER
jgi:hypothetical protein